MRTVVRNHSARRDADRAETWCGARLAAPAESASPRRRSLRVRTAGGTKRPRGHGCGRATRPASCSGLVFSCSGVPRSGLGGLGLEGVAGLCLLYLLGFTPWDTGTVPAELIELVEGNDALPAGRALDIDCGTGTKPSTLGRAATRMWQPSWRQRRSGARRAAGRVVEHGHASFVNRRDRLELDRRDRCGSLGDRPLSRKPPLPAVTRPRSTTGHTLCPRPTSLSVDAAIPALIPPPGGGTVIHAGASITVRNRHHPIL
jgi:hypothetical protein